MKPQLVAIGIGVAAAGALALYVWRKGGVAGAAAGIGGAAVDAVGGLASGAVGAAGAAVGLPTPADTTTDAHVARWLIDQYGYLEASKWSGAPALFSAMGLPRGSGTPPPAGSAVAQALMTEEKQQAVEEVDRLLRRYPAPDASQAMGGNSDGGPSWWSWGF